MGAFDGTRPNQPNTSNVTRINTLLELKGRIGSDNEVVYLNGQANKLDGKGGQYIWNKDDTTTEDLIFLSVIKANGAETGRWRRINAKVVVLPHGYLEMRNGIKNFYASGTTNSSGEASLNLTMDGTLTGEPIFTEIWSNMSRCTTPMASPAESVNSYTKSLASNLKNTVHGYFKANAVTLILGAVYGPFANAPAGLPVQFTITGI